MTATPLVNRRFLLLDNVGRGGMGRVYRAFDRATERIVAMKLPGASRRAGPDHPLSEEYRTWSALRHPNIIRVLELGTVTHGPFPEGIPFLVLESFRGLPAHRALSPGRIGPGDLREFARQVLVALDHIHGAGLVHRDVKPGNILVGPASRGPGRVKITDFGLATAAGRSGPPGKVSGSLPYLCPESILGWKIDGRSDLYGLGILLYFLASGKTPWTGTEPETILRWHLDGATADLRRCSPPPSERWARFVLRLTARNPADRPATAEDALFLLGCRRQADRRRRRAPGENRELASLRLALDAVRLGEHRTVRLPRAAGRARRWIRELRILAQIHGVAYHQVSGRDSGDTGLGRLVLELLLQRETGAASLVRRFALQRRLPLEMLEGLPVWDRERAAASRGDNDPRKGDRVARCVAAFLLESAAGQPMILAVEPSAMAIGPVRRTMECLRRRVASPGRWRPGGAGMLLLLPRGA